MFGNTHFSLGKKILSESNIDISTTEKTAFLSGIVYADVGRFKFDNEINLASDSEEFIFKMNKCVETSEEKWFVNGFKMHNFQDRQTEKFLKLIFGAKVTSYSEYIYKCGILEYYFMIKTNSFIFENFLERFNFEQVFKEAFIHKLNKFANNFKYSFLEYRNLATNAIKNHYNNIYKNHLHLYDDILKRTYKSLKLKVNTEEVQEQAANILGVCIISSNLLKNMKFPKEIEFRIGGSTKNLIKVCMESFKNNLY